MDLQQLADRVAIRELTERYTMGVTCRDWDAVASCYHDHAHWCAPLVDMDFKGLDAIVGGIRASVEANPFQLQMQHALVIDSLSADRATARSILHEVLKQKADEPGASFLGIYNDVITKHDSVWKFESRRFDIHLADATGLQGHIMVDYASLLRPPVNV
jgi:ketosteroid isomerase-like protein